MDIWHRALKESLPPEFERVLIYRRYARCMTTGCHQGDSWILDGRPIENEINEDDYWMRLPAPPAESY